MNNDCPVCGGMGFDYISVSSFSSAYGYKMPGPTCAECQGGGSVSSPIKITPANFNTLVQDIVFTEQWETASYQVRVVFRPIPGGSIGGEQFGYVVAKAALGPVSWQEYTAKMLNEFFAKNGMPQYIKNLLLGKSVPQGPGVYVGPTYSAPSTAYFGKSYSGVGGVVGGDTVVSDLRRLLPGISEQVSCPGFAVEPGTFGSAPLGRCHDAAKRCKYNAAVTDMIVHLNDRAHRWTREDIADWLESLDVDLTFPTDLENLPPAPPARRSGIKAGDVFYESNTDMIKAAYASQIKFQLDEADLFSKFTQQLFAVPPPAQEIELKILATQKQMNEDFLSAGKLTYDDVMKVVADMKAPKTVPYKPCDGLDCDLCSPFQCDLLDTPLPPPPSPLQAKKDHALKQQKLLEKLNKKSKKKEVK